MKHAIVLAIWCLCAMPALADSTVLHIFGLNQNDGENPEAGLTLDGSTLFGTASEGAATQGSVFSISTSGNNYTLLHTFSGASDGSKPFSPVLLQDGELIGTTNGGKPEPRRLVFAQPRRLRLHTFAHVHGRTKRRRRAAGGRNAWRRQALRNDGRRQWPFLQRHGYCLLHQSGRLGLYAVA